MSGAPLTPIDPTRPQTDEEWLTDCRRRLAEAEANLRNVQDLAAHFRMLAWQLQYNATRFDAAIASTPMVPISALVLRRQFPSKQAEVAFLLRTFDEWQSDAHAEIQEARDRLTYWLRAGLHEVT